MDFFSGLEPSPRFTHVSMIMQMIEKQAHLAHVFPFDYIDEKNLDILFVINWTADVGGETAAKDTIENVLIKRQHL